MLEVGTNGENIIQTFFSFILCGNKAGRWTFPPARAPTNMYRLRNTEFPVWKMVSRSRVDSSNVMELFCF